MLGLGTSIVKPPTNILADFVNATIQGANGFVFDGTGDFLEVDDHPELSFDDPENGQVDSEFSYAVWIKRDSVANGVEDCLMSKCPTSPSTDEFEYRIFFSGNDLHVDTHTGPEASYKRHTYYNGSTANWQHWVITHNGSPADGVTIYLNGSDVGTLSTGSGGSGGNMSDFEQTFKIGRMEQASFDFDGRMMEATLWKSELQPAEVAYLYAGGTAARDPNFSAGAYYSNNAVVAWWPMTSATTGHKDNSGSDFASSFNFDATKEGNVDLDTSNDGPF